MATKPTTDHAKGHDEILISKIFIDVRERKDTQETRTFIDEFLAPSIAQCGLLQPPTLDLLPADHPAHADGFTHILISGWCRIQSFILLGHKKIPFNLFKDLSKSQRAHLELIENQSRRGVSWQEECLQMAKIHEMKKNEKARLGKNWGQRETGLIFDCGVASVNNALFLAQYLKDNDKEIWASETARDASRRILTRQTDAATQRLVELTKGDMPVVSPKGKVPTKSGPMIVSDPLLGLGGPAPAPKPPAEPKSDAAPTANPFSDLKANVPLSQFVLNIDFREFAKNHEPETFDGILTDIPYALNPEDLENLKEFKSIEGSHQQSENLELFPEFAKAAFRLLKKDTYCIFYYDILWQETFRRDLESAGFSIQPFPLLWLKPTCKNMAAFIQWPKSVEYLMVARKGSPKLLKTPTSNWLQATNLAEARMQKNPFSKPFVMTKWICEHAFLPSSQIWEPFAGGGSIARGLVNCGMRVVANEKDPVHMPDLIRNFQDVYRSLLNNKVTFS